MDAVLRTIVGGATSIIMAVCGCFTMMAGMMVLRWVCVIAIGIVRRLR